MDISAKDITNASENNDIVRSETHSANVMFPNMGAIADYFLQR
jgi:hypothetical protein